MQDQATQAAPAPGNGIVQIAYLHLEHVSHSFMESMRKAHKYDRHHGGGRLTEDPLNIRCSSGRLVPSRNFAAQLFLDKLDHEWLMFIDTDMGFEEDAIHRLLDVAHPVERPVVGGLCFAYMEQGSDGMNGWDFRVVPTMYKIGETVDGGHPSFCYYGDYIADAVTPVAATGAAFLLIHRTVLEKMRAEFGAHWFDQLYDHTGFMVGEDFSFCLRLGHAGIPLHVHTGVETTHHKEVWLGQRHYIAQREQEMIPVNDHPEVDTFIHVGASLATLVSNDHDHDGMLKLDADMARYQQILDATRPEVIVETGTRTGGSARALAVMGQCDAITVDVDHTALQAAADYYAQLPPVEQNIDYLLGDSADPAIVDQVRQLVGGRRAMVILDSDHSAAHVAAEIEAYGPMVSVGCYLVVEDTIFGLAPEKIVNMHFPAGLEGSPLDAVAQHLVGDPQWSRDIAIERASPTSHHPAGWWIRVQPYVLDAEIVEDEPLPPLGTSR
jgi:cephalosporin hydroxylase